METKPEDDYLCEINNMGKIAVYREGTGWQWLWQDVNVLTLKWDDNGKRERLYQDEAE